MDRFLTKLFQQKIVANLLMVFFIVAGLLSAYSIRQEFLPIRESRNIQINVELPQAQPEEIERSVLLPIENAVRGLGGIKKVDANAKESFASVTLALLDGADINKVFNDVKNAIDRIENFPQEAEKPTIMIPAEIEKVMSLVVYGEQPSLWLERIAEKVRDTLLIEKGLTKVQLAFPRSKEISVEVEEKKLRTQHVTLEEIAARIKDNAFNLSGGTLFTPQSDIALRVSGHRDTAVEFMDIVVKEANNGSPVRLSEIATVKEGFGNSSIEAWYNSKPTILIDVYAVGQETPLFVEGVVKDFLSTSEQNFSGVAIEIFENDAQTYRDRMDLLVDNAFLGLVLVMCILALFLTPHIAFWVMVGIPTALLGGLALLYFFDISLNMISLFAFIVTIGVVVDDAIMVSEAVYRHQKQGRSAIEAAVMGVKEMAVPIFLAVSTTIIAFMPMFFIPGKLGILFEQISAVVVAVLVVSLIETLFILVRHLSNSHMNFPWPQFLSDTQRKMSQGLENFTYGTFRKCIRCVVLSPIVTLCVGGGVCVATIAIVASGTVGFSFTPDIQSDTVAAQITLPYGTPKERSIRVQEELVKGAFEIAKEQGDQHPRIFSLIGARLDEGEVDVDEQEGAHYISVLVALPPEKERKISGSEFANLWQQRFGEIGGVEASSFSGEVNVMGGEPFHLELSHADDVVAQRAALSLADRIRLVEGIVAVDDGLRSGKPEFNIILKKHAVEYGLTLSEIAKQIQHRFYGMEAMRFVKNGSDIRVMVRLTRKERGALHALDHILIKTPHNTLVPLLEIADITQGQSPTSLLRRDGKRIYSVIADIAGGENEDGVEDIVDESIIPQILKEFPGVKIGFGGDEEEIDQSLSALGNGFLIVICVLYTIFAVQFNSYIQPLLILSVVPFAFIGAIWGHIILGYDISIMSVVGGIAMAGVIVNDSLVLVTRYNQLYMNGVPHIKAIADATCSRFRPVFLTTLTTFLGLAPMMLETSEQAQFLIPMAVAISFGLIFGMLIVLIFLPVLLRLFGRSFL